MAEPLEWTTGPVLLREIPATRLRDLAAYALHEDADRGEVDRAVQWCRAVGASVPFVNSDGFLLVSNYVDEDGALDGTHYYEFVRPPVLMVHDPRIGEVSCHGYASLEHYGLEWVAP